MNCVEFERVLVDYLEGIHNSEQQAHLNSCSSCSGLLADLNLISSRAMSLQATEEPSPRVWNALEIQLRQEGLIRPPAASRPSLSSSGFLHNWRMTWLVPIAAVLVIAAGIKLYQPQKAGDNYPVAKQSSAAPAVTTPAVSPEDRDVLSRVAERPPAQQASYKADLDDANAFIRDAEQSVRNDPNDVYAQRMLVNAYEQKQMLYDLAVDRGMGEQ